VPSDLVHCFLLNGLRCSPRLVSLLPCEFVRSRRTARRHPARRCNIRPTASCTLDASSSSRTLALFNTMRASISSNTLAASLIRPPRSRISCMTSRAAWTWPRACTINRSPAHARLPALLLHPRLRAIARSGHLFQCRQRHALMRACSRASARVLLLQRAPARLPVPSARAPPAEPLPHASPAPLTRTSRAACLRFGRHPLGAARLRAAHPRRTLQRLLRALARAMPARPRRLARLSAPRPRAALPAAAWIPSASPPSRTPAPRRAPPERPPSPARGRSAPGCRCQCRPKKRESG
jgi:hypothetical protein